MMNKPWGDGREVLDIPPSFFVHRLVGIGAKSFVALSHQCLKGFVVNVDHTKKCLGGEGRNMQERTPWFFSLDHCASISHPSDCSQEGDNV